MEKVMQTIAVQIQDNFMQSFLNFVNNHQENIAIAKDSNLELDSYYYERKKELERIIKECEDGTMELLSQEQYDKEMEIFFKDLKANENI